MQRTFFAAAALSAGALIAAPEADARTLEEIIASGTLVMSTDPEYPPQSSLNADNEFEGFDIDVGREIASRLGVEIEFVTPGWDVITAGNWASRWDISVGSMTPTAARAEVLDFPAVYYFTPAVLVVHEDNTSIAAVGDGSGAAVGVGVATTYENYLNGALEIDAEGVPAFDYQIADADIRTYDTDVLALDDLRLGDGVRLDAVVTALPTVLEAIENGYPIRVVGEPLFLEPLSIATDLGGEALDARIAEIVAEMRADGALAEISERWYGADLTAQ